MPDWGQVLEEINEERREGVIQAQEAVDRTRRKYLQKLHSLTGRNIIIYYSGYLSKPLVNNMLITDEDKNGFMMCVRGMDRSLGLDLILHTPGGGIAATESIVNYLRKMFGSDIRAIVPQIAMSAGTMMACSCKEIIMGKHSNLGPIDPQLRGVSAHRVIREFDEACEDVRLHPEKILLWQSIIGKYQPTFLDECRDAIAWSTDFVIKQLASIMFTNPEIGDVMPEDQRIEKAKEIVNKLNTIGATSEHGRHLHYEDCKAIGLYVTEIEREDRKEFQDLLLTVHHCCMHTLMNTTACKVIENQKGAAFIKQLNMKPAND